MKQFRLIFALALLAACGGGVDKTQPTVRLSGSTTEVRFSGPITLTAFATDDRGLEKVEFFVGSSKLGVDTSAPYTWKVDYKAAQSGKKSYSAVATDTSGNSKESDSLVVNVAITRGFALLGAGSLNINANRNADGASLALDGSGNPVVAWGENDGTSRNVYVKRWNGTAWVLVGGSFLDVNTNQNAGKPSLALDSSGHPVVAWVENDGTSRNIYVKRWDGTTWVLVGNGFLDVNTDQDAFTPTLALDSGGNPVVAWSELDPTSFNVYVKRWNGTAWVLVGNGPLDVNVDQNAVEPSLGLDSGGNPVVAWSESDGTSPNVYVKRWTGMSWALVGSGFLDANTNQSAFKPSLALDSSGNPLVAWGEYDGTSNNIYVKRWAGTAWVLVGGGFLDVNTNQSAFYPSVKLDSTGNPMVAWSESDGISENIYLKRWSTRNWASVGIGSLDANANQNATSPSLALDSSGLPVVAWSETDSIANNIYVKRFND